MDRLRAAKKVIQHLTEAVRRRQSGHGLRVLPAAPIEDEMKFINAESLSKNFGTYQALDDVNFGLPLGESLAIVGPNGSGKQLWFAASLAY